MDDNYFSETFTAAKSPYAMLDAPFIYKFIGVSLIILIIYTMATYNNGAHEDYIDGLWYADSGEFIENANIALMMIYFGPPSGLYTQTRDGIITIVDDGKEIIQKFTINYTTGWSGMSIQPYCINADIEFEETDIMEPNVDITFDMINGTMYITKDDATYAILTKDNSN